MWNLIPILFETLFPNYKSRRLYPGQEWFIRKRRWLFFYKPLTHVKTVQYDNSIYSIPSVEILMFGTEEKAENEIDRLNFGYPQIKSCTWKDGKMVEVKYG